MSVKKLQDLPITKRKDLEDHEALRECAPPPVGVCVESHIYQYDGTNIVQWWVAKNGMWYPYGDTFVISEERREM